MNPPVLHLPKPEGRFILYSDTSIEVTGSSLWQVQEGKPRLICYATKTLPEACSRYTVTGLEMTTLLEYEFVEEPFQTKEIRCSC